MWNSSGEKGILQGITVCSYEEIDLELRRDRDPESGVVLDCIYS